MNAPVGASLRCSARDAQGTQTPLATVEQGSGSCRDEALAMLEVVRRLGDPTDDLNGASQRTRVALVRDPAFAAPISGIWYGEPMLATA